MGQGILSSRGGGDSGVDWSVMPGFTGWEHKYEEITSNKDWIVPRAKDNTFNVIVFGGGGGASTISKIGWDPNNRPCGIYISGSDNKYVSVTYGTSAGGGGGYMCNATLKLQFGNEIRISIGNYAYKDNNGGTTSFGSYLSALGGECGKAINVRIFNNGSKDIILVDGFQGGNGGAGGGSIFLNTPSSICGGSGQYGGGGGGYIGGSKGIYGGAGGGFTTPAQDGTNTMAVNTVYNGDGKAGLNVYRYGGLNKKDGIACGGGGYGGNGGDSVFASITVAGHIESLMFMGGGGGGWGRVTSKINTNAYYNDDEGFVQYYGGGGGGYKNYAYGGCTGVSGNGVCIIDYIAPVFN